MPQSAGNPVPWAARAVTASVGVLGWLAAQHLTSGSVEHTHLDADGYFPSHEHHYARPVALAAAVILGAGLAAVLGPRPGDRLSARPHTRLHRKAPACT